MSRKLKVEGGRFREEVRENRVKGRDVVKEVRPSESCDIHQYSQDGKEGGLKNKRTKKKKENKAFIKFREEGLRLKEKPKEANLLIYGSLSVWQVSADK
jgi:hypothetical protein